MPFPLVPEVREDQSLPPTIPGHSGRISRKGGDSGGKRGRGDHRGKRTGANRGEGGRHQGSGGENESGCLWDGGTDGSDRQEDDLDSRLKVSILKHLLWCVGRVTERVFASSCGISHRPSRRPSSTFPPQPSAFSLLTSVASVGMTARGILGVHIVVSYHPTTVTRHSTACQQALNFLTFVFCPCTPLSISLYFFTPLSSWVLTRT